MGAHGSGGRPVEVGEHVAARRAQGVGRGGGGALWSVWSAHDMLDGSRCGARRCGCPPGRRRLRLIACQVWCRVCVERLIYPGIRYSFFSPARPPRLVLFSPRCQTCNPSSLRRELRRVGSLVAEKSHGDGPSARACANAAWFDTMWPTADRASLLQGARRVRTLAECALSATARTRSARIA